MFTKKVLLALILIGIVARFVWLDLAPPHLSNDEIGAAYAAYSISKTLRDGSNQFLPLLWTSHGGEGAPLAIYVPLPSIMAFGNNDFAVRLPSAVLGSLTIIFIGLLVMELTKNSRLAITASFILAVSPWHFSASRRALESNYALFFIVLGIYLFFIGINRNKNWAILTSMLSFGMSVYSYYTEWILTPLIIISLIVFYRKTILKKRKIYIIAIIFFGILLLPLAATFINHAKSSRASSEFITQDIGVGRLLSNHPAPFEKGQIILKAIADKYSVYNSLDYLFFFGATVLPKENPYQFGFLLAPLLVPFIWGLYKLRTFFKQHSNFIYFLLFATPFAASLTEGGINNWRSLPQLLPISIISAVGVLYFWESIKKSFWKKIISLGLLFVSLGYFCIIYFIHFPLEQAQGYQYGYKQMASYLNKHYAEFEKIIIDPRFGSKDYYYIGVPSSYIPFYTNLDPRKVWESKAVLFGTAFDKYEFRDINWNGEKIQKNYLYIAPADLIPDSSKNLKIIYEIPLPDHRIAFRLYSLID